MAKDNLQHLSDEELVHRYRNSHDMAYMGELYQRYIHLVYGVCLKYLKNDTEAEDATMQLFEKLIGELKRHHVTTFRPWMYMVVKNFCMMEFRRQSATEKKQAQMIKDARTLMEKDEPAHLQDTDDREFVLQHLHDGLDALKEQQRVCIELFYLKDCSYNEISAITGYTLNEVKSHIQNGKRNLKNYITAKHEQAKKGD
ncbi:MAG: sigma-70 family RNA polymerase sigma factor [Chitinophagales bacterium]|nr:sigma-70 family RNA polymerase sigma factor [Chitinophagales bacterium]MDW8418563.1 sigma-70 family RNA polymerase sigma factor [Chitinophagales bacterium]